VVGTAVMTAPLPFKRSMHLSAPPVNDRHHIENLKLSDISGILRAKFRETPWVLNPVRIRPPLVLTGGVATCSGKEYRGA